MKRVVVLKLYQSGVQYGEEDEEEEEEEGDREIGYKKRKRVEPVDFVKGMRRRRPPYSTICTCLIDFTASFAIFSATSLCKSYI